MFSIWPHAAVVVQSHGQIRICAKGPKAERVLAKGSGVDLNAAVSPIGRSVATLVGHIAAHITRIDVDTFKLVVLRALQKAYEAPL